MLDRTFFHARSQELKEELISIRRHLHQHPELSFQEVETTRFLIERLKKLGMEVRTEYSETGVVALLRGNPDGPVVALRGDIDALPIEEKTGLPFASKRRGVMHACGHDLHTTCVLGAAMILSGIREKLPGTVKFIFQPGEEKNPGGAIQMIRRGVLEDPRVDAIFALHSDPKFRTGKIRFKYGVMMAEADEFYITIRGRGGHGSAPHFTVDPIVVAAEAILALQKIPSRLVDPWDHVVVTVSRISAGHTTNVIPDEAQLAGTVRTFSKELARRVEQMMRKILHGVTMAYDAEFDLEYDFGYPPLVNHPDMTRFLAACGKDFLGENRCIEMDRPSFGGEDFAYFLERVPGSFFRLGTGNPEKGITAYWHSSDYTVDEDALPVGAGFLAFLAYRFLVEHAS